MSELLYQSQILKKKVIVKKLYVFYYIKKKLH